MLIRVLAGAMPLAAVELPRRADEFVDSMGINANVSFLSVVYNQALVGKLGIRHFRSNVKPTPSTLLTRLTSLYSEFGFRVNLVCDSTAYTPSQYSALVAGAPFESVEGLNEPDVNGPRSYAGLTDNWATQDYSATVAFQQDLFTSMASQPSTLAKPVLSPAMANPAYSRFVRSTAADIIAVHSYPAQQLPTGNDLTCFAIPAAQLFAVPGDGVMRVIATETGYQSGSAQGDISDLAASKYLPRTYAEYFRLGVARTYLFELADVPGGTDYGVVDATFTPKPAYTTLMNLVGMLSESVWNPGTGIMSSPAAFNPAVLDYTMTGVTPVIHHVLLQKSTGVLYLLLWQEVPSYDLTANVDIVNPNVPVQLNFNLPIANAAVYGLESTAPSATYSNPQTLTINVPDEVVVVQLTPGSAPAPSGAAVSIVASPAGSTVSPFAQGSFVVARTGSVSGSLSVSYSVGGSATNGVDLTALSGSVQIPAGSVASSIPVAPINPLIVGGKEVVLTVGAGPGYTPANLMTSKVYINASRTMVDDFESGIQGWKGCTYSSVALDTANADTGSGDLKWVFTDDGIHRWANTIQLTFASPQDWSAVSRLELRLKEGPSNSASDIGVPVYFNWSNNGVSVGGNLGTAKFPLSGDAIYRTVSLDLGAFPRSQVNSIQFYVDGESLPAGTYTFYIDNLCAVTDTNGVLDDIEQYAGSNWVSSAQSSLAADGPDADTGVWCLKWTFTDDGVTRWSNSVGMDFVQPRDLARYSTLCLRFKEDAANPVADVGSRVYLDWHNNGASTSGGSGVASFPLTGSGAYRTVEIPMGEFNRDKVDFLYFYVDGSSLAAGKHLWYIDNVTVY
jgi:hypothetical protein